MSADNVIDFREAAIRLRAAKLRKEDTSLGRIFRNLEVGPNMRGIPTEVLIGWAARINDAAGTDTMLDVCKDVERMIDAHIFGVDQKVTGSENHV